MIRAPDLYARPALAVPPLPQVLAAALRAAPPAVGEALEQHRAAVLASPDTLSAGMRRIEVGFADWLPEDGGGGFSPPPGTPVGLSPGCVLELWAWVAYLAIVRGFRSVTTVANYALVVARFLAWTTERGLDYTAAGTGDFDAWQKSLFLTHKHSAKWRSRQASSVRSFYDWRHTRGLGDNCAAHLRSPRIPLSLPRKYTLPQLQGMLAATATRRLPEWRVRDRAILLLLLCAGLRREELCQLRLGDIDLGKQVAVIRVHGKGAKQREVSFEGPCVDALREWLLTRDGLSFHVEPEAVFVSFQGPGRGRRIGIRSLEHVVALVAREAKLREWGVHRFRVTFATALYDAGHELEEIRIVMGHESIETTRNYIAVSERARRTRLSSQMQHQVLGTRNAGQPRWVTAALGGANRGS